MVMFDIVVSQDWRSFFATFLEELVCIRISCSVRRTCEFMRRPSERSWPCHIIGRFHAMRLCELLCQHAGDAWQRCADKLRRTRGGSSGGSEAKQAKLSRSLESSLVACSEF